MHKGNEEKVCLRQNHPQKAGGLLKQGRELPTHCLNVRSGTCFSKRRSKLSFRKNWRGPQHHPQNIREVLLKRMRASHMVGGCANGCAYHVPACGQCGGCALERVCGVLIMCQHASSVWGSVAGCAGMGVLLMCQHVGSGGCALERVCLSCASMGAARWVCTGTGVLIMCQFRKYLRDILYI